MKKIALALIALVAVLSPLAAGESWIGVTTGPGFEIQKSDSFKDQGFDTDSVTDFNWDVNIEGAYYFNESETIGLGAKLGVGFNYATSLDIPAAAKDYIEGNPVGGTKISAALSFQYRLALAENLDLRLGAGLQYVHTFGNGMKQYAGQHPTTNKPIIVKVDTAMENLEIIANADVAYSLGDFQIFGGLDFGFTVMCYQSSTVNGHTEGDFITDGIQMSITPRVGVSYAF